MRRSVVVPLLKGSVGEGVRGEGPYQRVFMLQDSSFGEEPSAHFIRFKDRRWRVASSVSSAGSTATSRQVGR